VSGDAGGKKKAVSKWEKPLDDYRYNFTVPESRIMKAGNGKHFEQSYNTQAAVDTETMMVVGKYATNHANDKQELRRITGSVDGEVYKQPVALVGFYNFFR
jgi:hypothetical protein